MLASIKFRNLSFELGKFTPGFGHSVICLYNLAKGCIRLFQLLYAVLAELEFRTSLAQLFERKFLFRNVCLLPAGLSEIFRYGYGIESRLKIAQFLA